MLTSVCVVQSWLAEIKKYGATSLVCGVMFLVFVQCKLSLKTISILITRNCAKLLPLC